jgi:hypothetical protein
MNKQANAKDAEMKRKSKVFVGNEGRTRLPRKSVDS